VRGIISSQKSNRGEMKMKIEKTVSIGEAARICGVTVKQIRYWEDKNLIPKSDRVICGKRSYRQYSQDDFEVISRMKQYLDQGYVLSVAANKARP
jgi:DNA-binding transcriptional MerR regulator